MPKEHYSLESDYRLHPAKRHLVCGAADHEPRSAPEQRGEFAHDSPNSVFQMFLQSQDNNFLL